MKKRKAAKRSPQRVVRLPEGVTEVHHSEKRVLDQIYTLGTEVYVVRWQPIVYRLVGPDA